MAKKAAARRRGIGTPDVAEGCVKANMGNWCVKRIKRRNVTSVVSGRRR